MARTAIALAFVLLAACGKDVEDPGFTATASATMSTTGTSSSGGDETSSSGGGGSMSMSSTNADTTTDPTSAEMTGPTDETGGMGCGDAMIMPGEQCDGTELQGFTCESLGLNGGTLSCDPVTCTFDTSMCSSTSGGTSG